MTASYDGSIKMGRILMTLRAVSGLAAVLLASTSLPATADQFHRIATFHVTDNLPAGADAKKGTVAEIVAATPDGRTLVYTDSPGERVGIVDIADPAKPKAAGVVALGGEPTSVVVAGAKALVGVVTSESYAKPSGHVAVVDIASRTVEATCALGGQPDSLALSPDGRFLAVVIENERDEKVNDGAIPQLPSGNLTVFGMKDGAFDCASLKVVDLTGLAAIAPEDAEPEFVDINRRNEAVVSLQENNHIVVVDLASAKVVHHFSAGTVDLDGIDTKKDGIIDPSGKMTAVPREPDAVKWLDDDRFVTANEGDWKGGTRGFTIFRKDGTVLYEAGASLEMEAIRIGHYPDARNKKGIEVEGATAATFGSDKLLFVGSERGSFVGVYKDTGAAPEFRQVLPGGIGPEGLLAMPARNLLVTASEVDNRAKDGIGSVVTLYRYGPEPATYPTIRSVDVGGKPIGWGALSGLAARPGAAGSLYAVTDSYYATARILTIDASKAPATITGAMTVTKDGKPAADLDLEGIAVAADGGFWLASEGNPEREKNKTQSQLVKVDAEGRIQTVVDLPPALAAEATRFGFEGVTVVGSGAEETIWLAVQREWKGDPKGFVRLLAYTPATGAWGQVRYPLETAATGWVGLSEITAVPGGFVVIERDNQIGPAAKVKRLMRVDLAGIKPVAIGAAEVPVVKKTLLRDLLPELTAPNGYVLDKVEGFAIDAAGTAFVVTDNDGVDGSNGETQFLNLGTMKF
jgi:sugar lactone lactonase YvrE